ncbi:MAG: prepilin peptidase [Rhodomicrobium sp.]
MSVLTIQAIPWAASLAALAGCAATDLRARIVPDEFAVLIAVCGLALGLRFEAGQVGISLLAAIGVFATLGVLAHYGFIGGGDVKLISAVTLLVPPDRVGLLLIEIALAGGVLSCLYLAAGALLRAMPRFRAELRKIGSKSAFRKWVRREGTRVASGYPMPYALAVLGGVAVHIIRELPQCLSATSCSL